MKHPGVCYPCVAHFCRQACVPRKGNRHQGQIRSVPDAWGALSCVLFAHRVPQSPSCCVLSVHAASESEEETAAVEMHWGHHYHVALEL
jgi:hypothetical protein